MAKILLWIPMYNCEKQIVRVLNQLKGEPESYIDHVIIVNNRSTDRGEQAVIDYLQKNSFEMGIELLRNHENYGLGGSHKVAWQYAMDHDYEYVITLHGDDQGHISDMIPWIKNGEYQKHDCMLGSRFMKGSRLNGYSKFRTFGNRVFNIIFSVVTATEIKDLGAGLNLYHVDMLRDHHYIKFSDDLTFNVFGVLALRYYNQNYKFFPLEWSEDDQVSNVKMTRQAMKTLGLAFSSLFFRKKFFTEEHRKKAIYDYGADVIYSKDGASK